MNPSITVRHLIRREDDSRANRRIAAICLLAEAIFESRAGAPAVDVGPKSSPWWRLPCLALRNEDRSQIGFWSGMVVPELTRKIAKAKQAISSKPQVNLYED